MPKFESGGMPSYLSDQCRNVRSWHKCEVPTGSAKCLLFGVDRTYRRLHESDAFDPKRTSRNVRCSVAIRGKADNSTTAKPARSALLLVEPLRAKCPNSD